MVSKIARSVGRNIVPLLLIGIMVWFSKAALVRNQVALTDHMGNTAVIWFNYTVWVPLGMLYLALLAQMWSHES